MRQSTIWWHPAGSYLIWHHVPFVVLPTPIRSIVFGTKSVGLLLVTVLFQNKLTCPLSFFVFVISDTQGIHPAGGPSVPQGNLTDEQFRLMSMGMVRAGVLPSNSSSSANGSVNVDDFDLGGFFKPQSIFDEATQISLIVAFAVLILFGACGNGLVIYVVAKNPNMRTPRNIFIINLAISDMTLCCFTQPFNLMKVSSFVLDRIESRFVLRFELIRFLSNPFSQETTQNSSVAHTYIPLFPRDLNTM